MIQFLKSLVHPLHAASILALHPLSPFKRESSGVNIPSSPLLRPIAGPNTVEWTALGDSYAAGTGSGQDLGWGRCLRFSKSYPEQMNTSRDARMLGVENHRHLNFPACSGATTDEVLEEQFRDVPGFDWQYGASEVHRERCFKMIWRIRVWVADDFRRLGERPVFGDPALATLTIGGDDIDFVNLVRNCIYDILPWRSCDEQLKDSFEKTRDPVLVDKIDKVIKKIVSKGRAGKAGKKFRLHVTGYAEFFNAKSQQCSDVTWSVLPAPFGNRNKLTTELRETLNQMSGELNTAVQKAVKRNPASSVKYIDWEQTPGALDGHRYCEEGVKEPDDRDPDVWFWQYPQNYFGDPHTGKGVTDAGEIAFKNLKARVWDPLAKDMPDFLSRRNGTDLPGIHPHLHDSRNMTMALLKAANQTGSHGLVFPTWLVDRTRVFHPTVRGQQVIVDAILQGFAVAKEVAHEDL